MASTELIVSTADLVGQLHPFQEKANDLLAQADRAVIDSPEKADRGADFLKITKSAKRQLDDERKRLVEPYNRRIRTINGEFKKVTNQLDRAVDVANKKVLDFQLEQERKEREERERIEREAQERALEAAEEAEAEGKPEVADQILNLATDGEGPPEHRPKARGDLTGATTSIRKTWTGEIFNVRHVCRAIADGHLPESLIKEWSQRQLNELARAYGETAPADVEEMAQYGINYKLTAGLTTR